MAELIRPEQTPQTSWNLRDLRRSAKDKKIAGICGGLGEHTPVPSWVWRAAFVTSLFIGGLGLIAYIVLWVSMPPAKADS